MILKKLTRIIEYLGRYFNQLTAKNGEDNDIHCDTFTIFMFRNVTYI